MRHPFHRFMSGFFNKMVVRPSIRTNELMDKISRSMAKAHDALTMLDILNFLAEHPSEINDGHFLPQSNRGLVLDKFIKMEDNLNQQLIAQYQSPFL